MFNERRFVSVPCGVFVFLNKMKALLIIGLVAVSVPCGVFVFLNAHIGSSTLTSFSVSVPCGVFVFLNAYHGRTNFTTELFPSPAGSSYFSIATRSTTSAWLNASFRPLRGLRISQCSKRFANANALIVSVPCGVFVFLNDRRDESRAGSFRVFPSPAGSSYFSMEEYTRRMDECYGFRPLRGLRISQ